MIKVKVVFAKRGFEQQYRRLRDILFRLNASQTPPVSLSTWIVCELAFNSPQDEEKCKDLMRKEGIAFDMWTMVPTSGA